MAPTQMKRTYRPSSAEFRERAVRLVMADRDDYHSEAVALNAIAGRAVRVGAGGCHAEIGRLFGNRENDPTLNMQVGPNELWVDFASIENRVKALSARSEHLPTRTGRSADC